MRKLSKNYYKMVEPLSAILQCSKRKKFDLSSSFPFLVQGKRFRIFLSIELVQISKLLFLKGNFKANSYIQLLWHNKNM